ncbi:MAG: nitrous oxide-stimulated promoter family protein [Anaerolineales bacterium]|nr:nitrous oxide-stimulated promoter family protein [Anaerolineales bacterium]
MSAPGPRIRREKRTVAAMIELYCEDMHHSKGALCPDCQTLHDYAMQRLVRCPFQEDKTTCAKCAVHCYRPAQREQIRVVMRYAGPRMTFRHPILAVRHLLDGRKQPSVRVRPASRPPHAKRDSVE